MKSLLRWLIERLPQPFRERFGRELIAQVETEYELARVRGLFRA